MIIGLILLLVVLYLVFRKSGVSTSFNSESESPLEVLQKRYINGEIDKEEYLEKKDILKGRALVIAKSGTPPGRPSGAPRGPHPVTPGFSVSASLFMF